MCYMKQFGRRAAENTHRRMPEEGACKYEWNAEQRGREREKERERERERESEGERERESPARDLRTSADRWHES